MDIKSLIRCFLELMKNRALKIIRSMFPVLLALLSALSVFHPPFSWIEIIGIGLLTLLLFPLWRYVLTCIAALSERVLFHDSWLKTNAPIISVLAISAFVLIPNFANIFATDYLLQDDWAFIQHAKYRTFSEALSNTIFTSLHSSTSSYLDRLASILTDLMYLGTRVMDLFAFYFNYSFARFLLVLLLLIPSSWCAFFFLRRCLHLPTLEAFVASIVPAILPLQHEIASAVNLSYELYGIFFFWLTLHLAAAFLRRKQASPILFAAFVLSFTAGNILVGGEQILLMLPVLGGFILFYTKNWWRKAWTLFPLILNVCIGLFRWENLRVPISAGFTSLSWETCMRRLLEYLNYLSVTSSSIRSEWLISAAVSTIVLCLSSLILWKRWNKADYQEMYEKDADIFVIKKHYFIYLFSLGYMTCAVFPFLTVSPYMVVRLLLFSGYGYWILGAIGVGFLFRKISAAVGYSYLAYALGAGLLVFTGWRHYEHVNLFFKQGNVEYADMQTALTVIPAPVNCNIAVIGGVPFYSTHPNFTFKGYMAYNRKFRTDINGTFFNKKEYFREVFSPTSMGVLYPKGPLLWLPCKNGEYDTSGVQIYLYRYSQALPIEQKITEYKYFLRVKKNVTYVVNWVDMNQYPKDDTANIDDWFLYRNIGVGKWELWLKGSGEKAYRAVLEGMVKTAGVLPNEIAWGDPADAERAR